MGVHSGAYPQSFKVATPSRHCWSSGIAVRTAKPEAKSYKLADGLGMYLLVQPTGSKLWRMKYCFGGKAKVLALGQYPATI